MSSCWICNADVPDSESKPVLCEVCSELSHFEQQLLLALDRIGFFLFELAGPDDDESERPHPFPPMGSHWR